MDLFEHASTKRPSLFDTLERCRLSLNLSVSQWADILGLTRLELQKVRRGTAEMPRFSLLYAAEYLGVSEEDLLNDGIDFPALARKTLGFKRPLPDKYAEAAFSKRRSVITVLDYLEEFFGWRIRHHALRGLGADDGFFADPNQDISVRFITDLLGTLRRWGWSASDLFAMGAYSVVSNADSRLARAYRTARRPSELYEFMTGELLPLYESNMEYRIVQMSGVDCVIEAQPRAQVVEAMSGEKVGSDLLCMFKSGLLSSAPGYLGLPFATVEITRCRHGDDAKDRYEINYERAKDLFTRRERLQRAV